MEIIKSFLANVNSSGRFFIDFKNIKSNQIQTKCSLRFVFLEIGSPAPKQAIFLPDFIPSQTSSKNNEYTFVLESTNQEGPTFYLKTQDKAIVKYWTNYALDSRRLLEELTKITIKMPIVYEEPMTASIELKSSKKSEFLPSFVRLEKECITFTNLVTKEIICKVDLTNRTSFEVSPLTGQPFVLIDNDGDIYKLHVASFESLETWYLSLIIARAAVVEKEKEHIKTFTVEAIKVPEGKKKEPKIKKEVSLKAKEDTGNQKQILEAKKLESELKKKLAAYKRVSPICTTKPEPEVPHVDPSELVKRSSKALAKGEERKATAKTEDEIKELFTNRVKSPAENFSRLAPQICYPVIDIADCEYDPSSSYAFEEVYKGANDCDSFLLLCAIVYNGFVGPSLSDFYGVPRLPGENLQTESAKIVQTFEGDLFKTFLEDPRIKDFYSPDSIARDTEMILRISQIPRNFENPGVFPKSLPFAFSHRPLEKFANWFYDMKYLHSMNMLDSTTAFFSLVEALYCFFSHYIITGEVINFVREISYKAGSISLVGPWALVKNAPKNDDWNVFVEFCVESFKEGELLKNFTMIYSYRDIIIKHYDPCSIVRSSECASIVAGYLKAFEKLGVSTNIDLARKTGMISTMGKSIFNIVEELGKFKGFEGFHNLNVFGKRE